MATVTGLTSARMKQFIDASITDARLDDNFNLILTTEGGQDINVGKVQGPPGQQGPAGTVTKVAGIGDDGTGNVPLKPSDFGAASTSDISTAVGAAMPVGTILMTGRTSAPAGFALCQGQAVARTGTYAALYAAVGTSFGAGDGSTTFNVPDLRGRVAAGRNTSDTLFDAMGEKGGAKEVTLAIDEMPSHSHWTNMEWNSDNTSGTFGLQYQSTYFSGRVVVGISGNGRQTAKNGGASGVTQAHNNLQPYQVVNYMIKI